MIDAYDAALGPFEPGEIEGVALERARALSARHRLSVTTGSTSANSRPSTSPRFVSRSAGITPSDRNETIMNGYSIVVPRSA